VYDNNVSVPPDLVAAVPVRPEETLHLHLPAPLSHLVSFLPLPHSGPTHPPLGGREGRISRAFLSQLEG